MNLRQWLQWSGLLALVAPAIWFAILTSYDPLPSVPLNVLVTFWPSAIFMMATIGIEGTAQGYSFVAFAVLANVVLYVTVGGSAWCVLALVTGKPVHKQNE